MSKSTKHRKRPQAIKDSGNRALYDAMQEARRSSACSPHVNRSRYNRNEDRRERQSGAWA